MEREENKLFIGGISWETTEEKLREYFSNYGEVTQAVIMHDKTTGRPRGFGFVLFSDSSSIDSVLQHQHTLDGRLVEAKRALSREEQNARQQQSNAGRGFEGGGQIRTKKIFVGGLPPSITEEGFRQYFEQYGNVTDAVIMFDQSTQRPRGFGFITFDSEDAVDSVLHKTFHELDGKDVEVKRALPKESSPASNNRSGGYQSYGSSRNNSGSYDNSVDGNRFMQPQSGGNFSQYPGYNAAGYPGYGMSGYGGYGMSGYGAPASGFAGSNAVGAGYGGGSNAMRSGWNNQNPGYGSSGYGQGAGYGTSGSAQTGQYPGAGQGYNNQAYGGYGSNAYGSSGYGAAGGRSGTGNSDGADQTASGGGYMGSSYGDNNRSAGYGGSGGYGDSQSWQGRQ